MQEKAQILIVDDEHPMRAAMEAVLARKGYSLLQCENGREALEILERSKVDLVITDMKMPVMSGSELLRAIQERYPRLPVVMITAYGTIEQAVEAMKHGAFDFITKPFSAEDLEAVAERALNPARRPASVKEQKSPASQSDSIAIVTSDPSFKRVLEVAISVAASSASVLIQGESGTGKELIARLIHNSSAQRGGPFVAVNCAALPENLLESELFGHERGSFTGAVGTKIGKFELAKGGTILLDEVSEMELSLQAKLLRVLQEREVDRVGGSKPIPVDDVRVVATTNRDLRQAVQKENFREDLYYRLNVIPLYVPPLQQRKGDIRLLTEHFVRCFSPTEHKKVSAELIAKLEEHRWPGNVRELQNACQRAVLLAQGESLQAEHFLLGALAENVEGFTSPSLSLHPGLSVAEAEKRLIYETLKATGNNKTKAAEMLGISIRTLRNKLHEYGEVGLI
jgi:DNA-binding NtrC family response regulator